MVSQGPDKPPSTVCRECANAKARRNGAPYRARRWAKIVKMYGGKCACPGCEQTRPVFLSLDHVNDDGAEHRRELGGRNRTSLVRTDALKYQPERYQLLCHNCNSTKGRHSCQEQ